MNWERSNGVHEIYQLEYPVERGLLGGGADFMEVRFYNVNALWHNVQTALTKMFPSLWSQIVFSVGLLPDHAMRCVKSGCCEGAGVTCEPAVCSVERRLLPWGTRIFRYHEGRMIMNVMEIIWMFSDNGTDI